MSAAGADRSIEQARAGDGELAALRAEVAALRAREQQLAAIAAAAPLAADANHTAGNLLLTVGIALHLAAERARRSRAPRLGDLAALLAAEAGDLPRFFASDPRAADVVPYLQALARELADDQRALADDCATGEAALEQLRALVALQARLQPGPPEVAPVALAELAGQALAGVLRPQDGIAVEVRAAPLPPARLDRRLALVVLAQLAANARQALRARPPGQRHLVVVLSAPAPGQQACALRDDGAGFDAAAAVRIGTLGYSTRPGAPGVGLYACRLALEAGGGRLDWHSDGPGRGATFTATFACGAATGP